MLDWLDKDLGQTTLYTLAILVLIFGLAGLGMERVRKAAGPTFIQPPRWPWIAFILLYPIALIVGGLYAGMLVVFAVNGYWLGESLGYGRGMDNMTAIQEYAVKSVERAMSPENERASIGDRAHEELQERRRAAPFN